MANVDRPGGFVPVGHVITGSYNGQSREYKVASSYGTALGVGDPVKYSGTGDSVTGLPTVERAAAGDKMVGVIVGFKVDPAVAATIHPGYLPASTGGTVLVCDDPWVIYEVQEDSDSGNIAITAIGEFADHVVTAGVSTTTGRSNVELDSSDAGTGDGWRILGLVQRPDNAVGTNAKWLVLMNEHVWRDGTGV